MSTLVVHLLVLTNALLLALPPSWCCMVRFPGKSAEAKPQCCRQSEPSPCQDEDKQPEPQPANDCWCHVDSTLPPDSDMPPMDLAVSGPVVMIMAKDSGTAHGIGHEVRVESFLSPPLQILHCAWNC